MRSITRYLIALGMGLMSGRAMALDLPAALVETGLLAANAQAVTILAVRADTKNFTAKPLYRKNKKTGKQTLLRAGGHIPGAALVDYKKTRAARKIGGKKITRMLPEKAVFETLMRNAGVDAGSAVVIVTKGASVADMTMPARVYWQLKVFGHDNVAILNGGITQWLLEGRPVSSGQDAPRKGDWSATANRKELLASSEDVANAAQTGSAQLVDNRSLGEYLGIWHKPSIYAEGHIPGAKPFPNELMTTKVGAAKFLPKSQLKALMRTMGVIPDAATITLCNSGHLAAGGWFIMSELLGNENVRLYDGSMHQWTSEKRPTTTMKME